MDKNEIHTRLTDILSPLCQARGLEIWGVEILSGSGGGRRVVRVYIDSPQGVSIDECEDVSRHLSLALDVEDLIPGAYTLEVSSPGLERLFFSPEQLRPYTGRTVRVRLRVPLEGRKNFQGSLTSVDPPLFTLSDVDTAFELSWDHVSKASFVYEHRDRTKPGKR